jgi:PKD repeat protein
MKGFGAGLLGAALVALAVLPSCNATSGHIDVVDPTGLVRIELTLARSHPDILYLVTDGGAVTEEASGIEGAVLVIADPETFRRRDVEVDWELHVVPAEAGRLEPASGRVVAEEASNRLSESRYAGGFRTSFLAAAGFRGTVTLQGRAKVVEDDPDLDLVREASLEIVVQDALEDPPPIKLTCYRQPSEGIAPLTVDFEAEVSGCIGPCRVRWEFGTGDRADGREASYTYTTPGEYEAVGILDDDLTRTVSCRKTISVQALPPRAPRAPSPSGPNRPPEIRDLGAVPQADPLTFKIGALVRDSDPGDTVRWELAVVSGPGAATFDPPSGNGEQLSTIFTATAFGGDYTVRVRAFDDHGGQTSATLTIPVL